MTRETRGLWPAIVIALYAPFARAAPPAPPYLTAVTDRAVLRRLDRSGFSLAARLGSPPVPSNTALSRNRLFASLVGFLRADLDRMQGELAPLPPALGPGRAFPANWLVSPDTFYELVGVINRIDRLPFVAGSCGEIRLIYRLAYRRALRGRPVWSRLPMTVNLVYELPRPAADPACRDTAARWAIAPGGDLARQLAGAAGPLAALRAVALPSRVEINLQSERREPAFRPDLAGHAGYLMRVFRIAADRARLVPQPLENTPDVAAIRAAPEKRAALVAFLREPSQLRLADEGRLVLPESFLAIQAVSVAPLGLERLANRPFGQLLTAEDFRGVDLSGYRSIRTPLALIRRLDELSCVGCHQARSLAGFHFLGEDADDDRGVNAVLVPGSPHFVDEQARRERYVRAIAAAEPPDEFRPFAERSASGPGGYGERCGLGDAGFADWGCAGGLVCRSYLTASGDSPVGFCLPRIPELGDPCEVGRVTQESDPHRDRLIDPIRLRCAPADRCLPRSIGFPGGMCTAPCGTGGAGRGVCDKVPALRAFLDCLVSGHSFRECFASAALPTELRACDGAHPCRSDYLCARSHSGEGMCVPPYFLFQLVVTGHPPLR